MKSDERHAPSSSAERPPVRLRDSPEMQAQPARWAVSLLRRTRPYEPVRGRYERIWANLQSVGRVARPGWLRLAFAAALLLVAGLFASAAFAQWPGWLARVLRAAPTESRTGPPAKPAPPVERPAAVPAMREPATAPPVPEATTPAGSGSAGHARRPPKTATAEESELLLAAMRALRVEHKPDRARAILGQYLAHHPKGALAEEALVMLIEAAVAHGDGDAATLAARYFELYPKGGFADRVRASLAGHTTGSP